MTRALPLSMYAHAIKTDTCRRRWRRRRSEGWQFKASTGCFSTPSATTYSVSLSLTWKCPTPTSNPWMSCRSHGPPRQRSRTVEPRKANRGDTARQNCCRSSPPFHSIFFSCYFFQTRRLHAKCMWLNSVSLCARWRWFGPFRVRS